MQITRAVTANKKTTIAGIAAFIALAAGSVAAFTDGDPNTIPDWNAVVTGFIVLFGLGVARDGDVSSQEVGIR